MVAAVAWVATALVILVATVPWVGTVGAVTPPLVRSYGGDGAADEQELGVEELFVEELCVDESFHSRWGLVGSSEELKQVLHW
jgi:hypothetical protein